MEAQAGASPQRYESRLAAMEDGLRRERKRRGVLLNEVKARLLSLEDDYKSKESRG